MVKSHYNDQVVLLLLGQWHEHFAAISQAKARLANRGRTELIF